jgi:hypothetical protein
MAATTAPNSGPGATKDAPNPEAPRAPALSYGRLIPVTVHFDDLDALGFCTTPATR